MLNEIKRCHGIGGEFEGVDLRRDLKTATRFNLYESSGGNPFCRPRATTSGAFAARAPIRERGARNEQCGLSFKKCVQSDPVIPAQL